MKRRFLMAHWDGGGNTPPQRALARELVRRGHEVHVISHDTVAEAVTRDGAAFHSLGAELQWDPAQERAPGEEGAFIRHHVAGSAAFSAQVQQTCDAVRPHACVIDTMLVSTLKAAADRGWRFAAFNHLGWIVEGRCNAFLGSVVSGATDRGSAPFFELLDRAPLVIASSYADFGTQGDVGPRVHFVGPIREPVAEDPWPRRQPALPFVLVSLSSMHQGQGQMLASICAALGTLPIEVLVTTGRGLAPQAVPAAANTDVRAFVPHDAILPGVDLVITHAGLGTLLFSAGAGVPCLCFPNGRDQGDNAGRVEALGLGRTMSLDATPAQIAEAVMAMLRDDGLRATCRAFAARNDRFGDLGRAAEVVEELAAG